MQLIDGQPVYSATDLVGFLACGHLTDLERSRPGRADPSAGAAGPAAGPHPRSAATSTSSATSRTSRPRAGGSRTSTSRTTSRGPRTRARRLRARAQQHRSRPSSAGDDVIFQACFFDGTWLGFADFLLRVETPTPTLPWSYEVADTKLARSVKASAVLQLCSYSEHLAPDPGRGTRSGCTSSSAAARGRWPPSASPRTRPTTAR